MTKAADFREFADDCLRWAATAKDESQRDTLLEMGRVWRRTAELVEDSHILLTSDPAGLLRELRAKLN